MKDIFGQSCETPHPLQVHGCTAGTLHVGGMRLWSAPSALIAHAARMTWEALAKCIIEHDGL